MRLHGWQNFDYCERAESAMTKHTKLTSAPALFPHADWSELKLEMAWSRWVGDFLIMDFFLSHDFGSRHLHTFLVF